MLPENPPPKVEDIEMIETIDQPSFMELILGCNYDIKQSRTVISKIINKPK
jgi:hypothetical protein